MSRGIGIGNPEPENPREASRVERLPEGLDFHLQLPVPAISYQRRFAALGLLRWLQFRFPVPGSRFPVPDSYGFFQ